MSNARDLALIEKWADIATPPLPTLASPTSPKPTKFCCCPNRRRYNLKQPKVSSTSASASSTATSSKSRKCTLHARNIFADKEFTFIDDVQRENDSFRSSSSNRSAISDSDTNSISSSSNNSNSKSCKGKTNISCDNDDYDDIVDINIGSNSSNIGQHNNTKYDGNAAVKLMNNRNEQQQIQVEWQKHSSSSNNKDNCLAQKADKKKQQEIRKYCAVTNRQESDNDNVAADALEQQQPQQQQQDQQQQQKEEIQRLSNSEHQFSNKENKVSNNNKNDTKTPTTTATTTTKTTTSSLTSIAPATDENNLSCNYCKLPEPQTNNNSNNNSKIDSETPTTTTTTKKPQQNKMTITATAATTTTTTTETASTTTNRKLSESGLTSTAAASATIDAVVTNKDTESSATAAAAAATASTAAITPTTPRSTTPSCLKTVITTTMVKRSPSNDSTLASHVLLSNNSNSGSGGDNNSITSSNANSCNGNSNGNIDGCIEPRRSVRERIAAYAAGNEQATRTHDNAYKYAKNSCNKNHKNMTSDVKSAISPRQQQQQQQQQSTLINGNSKCAMTAIAAATAATATATTPEATTSEPKIKSNTDKPCYKSGLSDVAAVQDEETSLAEQPATTTTTIQTSPIRGCATMPRSRRQPLVLLTAASNELDYNKHGSNNNHNSASTATASNAVETAAAAAAGCMTADKKFLGVNVSGAHKPSSTSTSTATSLASVQNCDKDGQTQRKLAALDNLDLAHSLDLIDGDDGEDPYYALEEYLERVKHEINEVFELRKAQRMHQQQQQQQQHKESEQQQQQESDEQHAAGNLSPVVAASAAASASATASMASGDELSRSTESDSGFDSATGERLASTSKLHAPSHDANGKKSSATTTTTSPALMLIKKPRALPPLSLVAIENNQSHVQHDDSIGTPTEVNIWANKFLRDLDNLMSSSDKPNAQCASAATSPTSRTSPMLLSAAAKAAIQSRYGKGMANGIINGNVEQNEQQFGLVLKPEKHATIPLQSFNLDCGRNGSGVVTGSSSHDANGERQAATMTPTTRQSVAYMRTLSAPGAGAGGGAYTIALPQGRVNRNSLATFNADPSPSSSSTSTSLLLHQRQAAHNLTNFQSGDADADAVVYADGTVLKIEESAAAAAKAAGELKTRRQRQLENDMETIRNALLSQLAETPNGCGGNGGAGVGVGGMGDSSKNMLVASSMAAIPKRERINHATTTTTTTTTTSTRLSPTLTAKMALLNAETSRNVITPPPTTSSSSAMAHLTPSKHGNGISSHNNYLLHSSDVTKKGSTSTIWTSEESILRSVGAVDEDNNSTSSSACEEANGVLSSGKSGISLDSSGLDNDNNESGIGTATPPKDMSHWKAHMNNDNESVSSLDALRKMKFQKSSSVASSDDPDLLEVLSLCDEPHNNGGNESHDEQTQQLQPQQQQNKQQQQEQQQQQQHKLDKAVHRPPHDADDSSYIVGMDELDLDADLDEDECHDEFETLRYCDLDCTDGDASSASGGTSSSLRSFNAASFNSSNNSSNAFASPVVLRRKYSPAPRVLLPANANGNGSGGGSGRALKNRSHSLDTSSLQCQQQQLQQLHHQAHPHVHGLPPLTRKLQHLQPRTAKERVQLSLALRQEPFQSLLSPTHFHELPSPSSASLHSGHESLGLGMQELTTKSNSAPLLLKQEGGNRKRDEFAAQNLTLRYSRSQSDRYLAEIEAVEACKWLRAAGFPQYAQMYEDHQFPIDLTNVAKDHTNLENDQLQSLYRRLCILNRCANMRLDQTHKPQTPQQKEDSDDENFALSENWTFQPHIRRWSRIGEMGLELPPAGKLNIEKTESSSKESSPDRFDDDSYDLSGAGITLMIPGAGGGGGGGGSGNGVGGACSKSDATDTSLNESADSSGVRLRRTGSERFKDGAKAFLRRVESIKSRRRKRQNREGVVISGPQMLDLTQLGQRGSMRKPDAVYSTPPSPSAVSPMHTFPKAPFFGNELKVPSHSENFLSPNRSSPKRTPTTPRSMRASPLHFFSAPMPHLKEGKSDDSSSYYSDSQESTSTGGGKFSFRKTPSKARRFLQRTGKVDDIGAHSDSECHHGRKLLIKDANSNTTEVKIKKLTRGGSLNLGKDPKKRDGFRSSSFRSRSTTRKDHKTTEDLDTTKRTPVVRWHSFQMEERPHMIFRKCFTQKIDPTAQDAGIPFAGMSAGQLQIIRKLALVTLTGHMERYCPTHRSGWNWELPKFIKKIKMPDYKDKKVFGVPLLLILQRSGQSLPVAVRAAFRWLQLNALDQIGIFRKSGGKSRITKLRELIECADTSGECMDVFDTQQAYDVADMLKQYFRELPESLLTTKMSETFVAIFQHLPPEVRLDAVQCAVLLLPDENREILYVLLEFLTIVAANAQQNQMTSNNLGVCLAQSIFHSSISTGSASVSASPRRKAGKGSGMPDIKELAEAKASHECLSFMIENYKQIYTASKDKLSKCNFGYMEESKPVPLEALGEGMQFHNWRGYLYECTSATIKEGREKTRGWFSITSQSEPGVDIAYKKVGDGHPLRLWRCITEIEGPPRDVLEYIIKQRASWDANLLQSQTVKKLDERTEIFQYALDGQLTTDFCVLRSWQTDLPRGACVIVETSIDHAKAKPMFGAVRGVVLASRYLIEPCGSGRSRVMHLARVDIKGKTPEWYNKIYGHISAHYLAKIRQAFRHIVTDGPESKV